MVTADAAGRMDAARRLAGIRAVLAGFDWDHGDPLRVLEQVERLALTGPHAAPAGCEPVTTVEPDGSAWLAPADRMRVLAALSCTGCVLGCREGAGEACAELAGRLERGSPPARR